MVLPSWIEFTLLAAVAQSVRTAGQKHLTRDLGTSAVTLVRFLFGLPFAAAYLSLLVGGGGAAMPAPTVRFFVLCTAASASQVAATVLLVRLFSMRNFAVGTTYARTEAFLTALVAVLFFDEVVTATGWLAIAVSVSGVVLVSVTRGGLTGDTFATAAMLPSAAVGLGSGLGFALSVLWIRQASLSLGADGVLVAAATTLLTMVAMQTAVLTAYVAFADPGQFAIILRRWRVSLLIGLTSVIGSVGWFTAATIERASYVKALGQIEFVFTLALSVLFFRERPSARELVGMILIASGVVVLVVGG